MKTYLILSNSPNFSQEKINGFKKKYAVADVDTFPIKAETSIGIAQVRQTLANMKNRPLSGETKMLTIESIDHATVEAQNALLKILEEAPESTVIVMTARNDNQILPTVLSRSQIIRDKKGETPVSNYLPEENLAEIMSASAGQRLELSENWIKTREDALVFLDKLTATLEKQLMSTQKGHVLIANSIRRSLQARKFLEGNVNYKLVIDILLLGFPQS